jgi:DNA-binding transcriptional LysR family regulator
VPRSPADLHDYPRVVFDSPYLSPWRFRHPDANETCTITETPRLLVSSPDAATDAAIDGVGATLLLEHDVAESVGTGKLQFILEEFEVDPIPVHLVYLSRDMMPMKLRRFIDFAVPKLREALADFGRIPAR